jgi:hypothetical protein
MTGNFSGFCHNNMKFVRMFLGQMFFGHPAKLYSCRGVIQITFHSDEQKRKTETNLKTRFSLFFQSLCGPNKLYFF